MKLNPIETDGLAEIFSALIKAEMLQSNPTVWAMIKGLCEGKSLEEVTLQEMPETRLHPVADTSDLLISVEDLDAILSIAHQETINQA